MVPLLLRVRSWWARPRARRLAAEKRRLERVCRECGVSQSIARRVTGLYFAKGSRDGS
jgi:hypothetical protein